MSINTTNKKEEFKLTGKEKMRLRKIFKENPVYFDKIIRDLHGKPPPKSKIKQEGPVKRNKEGKVIRALVNKGGLIKGKK